ncbi:MAG: tRNA (guanosine(46)-N7)-methyltransferase TrmB [Bacteroidales bacterium]|nr:tRNA (guanosine(46)-N7)-methyltransferase TrmB [Bacteroidales bacterium]
MSTIGKLEKFRQNSTFKCLLQPKMEEVFRKDWHLKGKWHEEVFRNSNPITLELGCGKGEYTVSLAKMYPDRNFIGIDIKGARLWKGAREAEETGLGNVRFIRTSIDFIEWMFGNGEIDEIWITFADPQLRSPRKRLTGTMFLERYRKFLKESGKIHLKTDSRLLHEYTCALAQQNSLEILCRSTDIYGEENPAFPSELKTVQTFYEQFFLKMGLPITYLCFRLGDASGFREPEWDSALWLEKENEGRTLGRIR